MSSFTFDVNGTQVTCTVEERPSTIADKKAYAARAKCPLCKKELKIGYGMGDRYRESEVKSFIKGNMKKHIKNIHKK